MSSLPSSLTDTLSSSLFTSWTLYPHHQLITCVTVVSHSLLSKSLFSTLIASTGDSPVVAVSELSGFFLHFECKSFITYTET